MITWATREAHRGSLSTLVAQLPPGTCQASTLWSPPCRLLRLAAFLCSLLPAGLAPCPHWCPCQSSIPRAWLHLPSRG